MHALIDCGDIELSRVSYKEFREYFDVLDESEIRVKLALDDKRYERYLKLYKYGIDTPEVSFLYFMLTRKLDSKIIGECGFHTWNKRHNRAELFYSLFFEEDKNKGIMSRIVPVVIDYGYTQMKLHRIEAFVEPSNTPSIRLLEKFQFEKEGYCKEHYYYEGKYDDSVMYALIKK